MKQFAEQHYVLDARHFISQVLSEEMDRFVAGEVSLEMFTYLVDALERQTYNRDQVDFFPAIRELAKKRMEVKNDRMDRTEERQG